MLRVVIADDEERVLKLIQALTDWQRLDMTLAGAAGNGLEALELVRELMPDILITDIRMPGYSGLELIKKAKEIAPFLEVIIISGYAQFDYAQTAIQHGVGEYLLKPVNKEALNNTLERLGQRCRDRIRAETDMESLRSSSRDDRKRLRSSLIPDLLDGRFAACSVGEMEETYHFRHSGELLQAFLLKLDYDIDQYHEPSLNIVRQRAEDVFQPVMAELCGDFLLGFYDGALWGIMSYPVAERDVLRGRLRECLNQLVALVGLFGPVVFSVALAHPVRKVSDLTFSVEEAGNTIMERLTEGTGRLLEGAATPSSINQAELLERYAVLVSRAIEMLDPSEAQGAADALEATATAVPGIRGWELVSLVHAAGGMVIARLCEKGGEQALVNFQLRCRQRSTVRGLFDGLRILQRELFTEALERKRSQEGQPIRLAKQYIRKNFTQPLTLEEVSAATGFSVSYFSTLFKKETGDGFNKYLTRVRMEEARNLLRETRQPIADICRRVGYVDIKHFTHTFKQETGLTPSEFRKVYG